MNREWFIKILVVPFVGFCLNSSLEELGTEENEDHEEKMPRHRL